MMAQRHTNSSEGVTVWHRITFLAVLFFFYQMRQAVLHCFMFLKQTYYLAKMYYYN